MKIRQKKMMVIIRLRHLGIRKKEYGNNLLHRTWTSYLKKEAKVWKIQVLMIQIIFFLNLFKIRVYWHRWPNLKAAIQGKILIVGHYQGKILNSKNRVFYNLRTYLITSLLNPWELVINHPLPITLSFLTRNFLNHLSNKLICHLQLKLYIISNISKTGFYLS